MINAPIHRIFHDENEQNLWLKKSANEELSNFLDQNFDRFKCSKNDFLTGKVNQSARLNVNGFFSGLFNYFEKTDHLVKEKFDYSKLNPSEGYIKILLSKNMIFCEGMGVKDNPYFSEITVNPNKGHHIKVKLSQPIPENITIKRNISCFRRETNYIFMEELMTESSFTIILTNQQLPNW